LSGGGNKELSIGYVWFKVRIRLPHGERPSGDTELCINIGNLVTK
jgi:hypothetical protein